MTILVNSALTVSKLKARFLEPYTSESINRFFYTQGLFGIHYGFDIQPDPVTGPLAIKLKHNALIGRSLAVIPDRAQRLAFTFDEDVEQVVNLAAYTGQRVYVYLYVAYTTAGTPTEIRLRVADAAELANPWVLSALLLGTVRVPSSGALTVGQIDKGSAVYAGLLPGAARRWQPHTTNPEFTKGLAGLLLDRAHVGADRFITLNVPGVNIYELELGNTTGTSGAQGPHLAGVVVPDVKVGDQILVRFTVNAASIANSASLSVVFGATNLPVLTANSAGYESFGILHTVTALDDYLMVALRLNLPNANSTAQFLFRRFEVFKLRVDPTLAGDLTPPADISARFLSFGNGSDAAWSSITHEGANNHPVFRLPTTGSNNSLTAPLALTEDDYTTPSLKQQTDDGPSLLRAAMQGTRAFGMMASLFPQAVIDGAALTVVLPDEVQISSGIISAAARATEADPYGTVADNAMLDPFDAAYNGFLTVSVPTTGNPVLIMWDGAEVNPTQRLIAIEAASVGSYPYATPLAWVEYSTGTNQIVKLIDVRDKLVNVEGKLTMYVGASSNNRARMTLEGALQLVGVFAGPSTLQGRAVANFEIVVLGSHTITSTLQLQSHVTIRGEAYGTTLGAQPARLLLAGGQTKMFTTGTSSLTRVTLRDLDLAVTDAGATCLKIENNTSISKLVLERCRIYTVTNPWKYGIDTGATNAYVNGMELFGCEFVHGAASDDSFGVFLRDQSLSAAEIVVDRCKFDLQAPGTRIGTHLKVNSNSTFTTHVTRCRFGQIQGDDFAGTFFGVDVSGNSNIDGCTFGCSVRCYPGTALVRHYTISNVKIERTGDGGGGLLDNTVGLVLEKGADNSTTIAQLSNVKVRTDALDPFGAQANVEGVSVRGAGNGTILVQMSNVHVTLPAGAGVVFVTGVYERASAGISQLQIDNLSVQGQNTSAAGTRAHGVWLGAQAARGTLKGLRMEDLDDNRAVYFDTGALKNVLGFMTVIQASAGAGFTDVGAANTELTSTIVVN